MSCAGGFSHGTICSEVTYEDCLQFCHFTWMAKRSQIFLFKKVQNSFFPSFEVFLGGRRPLDHPIPCFRGVANSVKYWFDALGRLKDLQSVNICWHIKYCWLYQYRLSFVIACSFLIVYLINMHNRKHFTESILLL